MLRRFTAALVFSALAGVAAAQEFPNRPITFVFPYPAGSNADTAWRAVGQKASELLGVAITHENRPGAGGRAGLESMMRADADGYTIGTITNALAVNGPLMDAAMAIAPGDDYTPVACCIFTPLMLIAKADAPYKDLAALVAEAKKNPGAINGGSSGIGTVGHVSLALLNQLADIDITHVPYQGLAPALTAILSGELDLVFIDAGAKPQYDQGNVIGLVVGDSQRWDVFPDVSSAPEVGLPGLRTAVWHGIAAPAGLDPAVLAKLNKAYTDAFSDPDVQAKLKAAGFGVRTNSSEDFEKLIRDDLELLAPVIEAAGLKKQ